MSDEADMHHGAPARVQVALVVLQTLRSAAHHATGGVLLDSERGAVNAACQVLALYLLGENDYRDDGGRGRIVRPPQEGGPGPTPAGVST